MKTTTFLLTVLCAMFSFGQTEKTGDILINTTQTDDTYRAGESIKVNSVVQGDLVIAGGNLVINDSINGDLIAAGGELYVNGYIADDVRLAVGRVTINSEIEDDLIVFGGEVILTENAKVNGNLKCFGGNVEINGEVNGKAEIKGTDVSINGVFNETSKIISEEFTVGPNAKFHSKVEYWNSDGEIDFKEALVNTEATFNESLGEENSELSATTFGTKSPSLWVFYILSAFLVILILHSLFRNTFSEAVEGLEKNWFKSFGIGLIYLFGIPLLIILAFLIVIGIPIGLFATGIFLFSLLFGHLIAALLLVYYYKHKKTKKWNFWGITFLALCLAIVLRLFTMLPYVGILLSVVILSITYGALTLKVISFKIVPVKK
ncbi:hypothetical protein ACOKFD_14190 [Flagellimonas sp. S174]|uniref:hypothetical protein n=1 Tax=Flagellimonas sp. S174 TaxID=3410790 RepID=UPI003BF51BB8